MTDLMERKGGAGDPDDEIRRYVLRRHPARQIEEQAMISC
jgi:hypothetical protein